ncbi:MlaE family ABC transporter permease [Nocardioides sp. Root190]|uniref:MlaE family ABC transporter permease n=1 Tax=Nocardioides sp. Root190 TaxID=1736488 RepID=UPI000A8696C8|nr:ABC transporter permease [Nocardioides sp. Root190]
MTDTIDRPAEPAEGPEQPTTRAERTAARIKDTGKIRAPFEDAGELVAFALRVIKELPVCVRLYPGEILRQCAYLIRSNALVILFMLFMLGALLGITGTFLFEGIGLESYVAAIPAVPLMRGVVEIVFGWVLAAKYGCGIVAELGAMRISEEIDAMDVMGVRSLPYLVGCRVIASMLVLPALFVTSLGVFFVASKLFFVDLLSSVSSGGFTYVLFLLQSPRDFFIAVLWGTVSGFVITVVACFYGYNASGGPVGVGRNTAQGMLVNLVLISVIAMIMAQIFYANVLTEAFGT